MGYVMGFNLMVSDSSYAYNNGTYINYINLYKQLIYDGFVWTLVCPSKVAISKSGIVFGV